MKNIRNKFLILFEVLLAVFGMVMLQSCFSEHYGPPGYGPYAYGPAYGYPVYQQPPVVVNHYVPVPVYRNGHNEVPHHEEPGRHRDHDHDHDRD